MLSQVKETTPALHRSTSSLLGYYWATTEGSRDYYHIEHTASGALATDNDRVDAMLRRLKATEQRYLFAINTRAEPTQAAFRVKGLSAGTPIRVLFENRTLTATAQGLQDDFAGYQLHIYVWGPTTR